MTISNNLRESKMAMREIRLIAMHWPVYVPSSCLYYTTITENNNFWLWEWWQKHLAERESKHPEIINCI